MAPASTTVWASCRGKGGGGGERRRETGEERGGKRERGGRREREGGGEIIFSRQNYLITSTYFR